MLAGAMFLPVWAGAAQMQTPRAWTQKHAIRARALHHAGRRTGVDVLEGEHEGIDVRFPAFTDRRRKTLL